MSIILNGETVHRELQNQYFKNQPVNFKQTDNLKHIKQIKADNPNRSIWLTDTTISDQNELTSNGNKMKH